MFPNKSIYLFSQMEGDLINPDLCPTNSLHKHNAGRYICFFLPSFNSILFQKSYYLAATTIQHHIQSEFPKWRAKHPIQGNIDHGTTPTPPLL